MSAREEGLPSAAATAGSWHTNERSSTSSEPHSDLGAARAAGLRGSAVSHHQELELKNLSLSVHQLTAQYFSAE